MFLFFDGDACVEQDSNRREFVRTKERTGVGTVSGNSNSARNLDLI